MLLKIDSSNLNVVKLYFMLPCVISDENYMNRKQKYISTIVIYYTMYIFIAAAKKPQSRQFVEYVIEIYSAF